MVPYATALRETLPDAVFTGYLAGEALATAYASADIFVFPSTTDTFGNVILEAQACGLPVIVSDVGGPRELVENGVNGFVTKAHDADAFRAMRSEPWRTDARAAGGNGPARPTKRGRSELAERLPKILGNNQ